MLKALLESDDRVIVRGVEDKAVRAGKFTLLGPFTAPVYIVWDALHDGGQGYEASTATTSVTFSTASTPRPLVLWQRREVGFEKYHHQASEQLSEKLRTILLPAFVAATFLLEYDNTGAEVTKADLFTTVKWA